MGNTYLNTTGANDYMTGSLPQAPSKSANLLDGSGYFFTQSKPQYDTLTASEVLNVLDYGVSNDATGDQTAAINAVLASANGQLVFFPFGIYTVEGTIIVPTGSQIAGEAWSQIMATGSNFSDINDPQVMVQVGQLGDVGSVEITDLLFTVSGPTAGAILMEWNIQEETQGSAAMWDSHFRVGGALGSSLQADNCPKLDSVNPICIAATLLLHITSEASGYFENMWAWVADDDMCVLLPNCPGSKLTVIRDTPAQTPQISVYAARVSSPVS